MNLDDLPHQIEIQVEVSVGNDVSKSTNGFPSNIGMTALEFVRQLSRGLCQRLKSPEHGILDVNIVLELVSAPRSSHRDQFY